MNGQRYLRLVEPPHPPPQARRRIEVRIVSSARMPIGRSRTFRLTESDVALLIAAAMRMEARA
jgi:hypothetical protein